MKLWEWTILIIAICILLFFVICQAKYPRLKNYISVNIPQIHTWDDIKNIDNGDLLFLSGTTYAENICKYLGDCIFSHIGILFVENNKIYVFECDIGQSHKDGVRVISLEDKLKKYKGDKICCIKKLIGKRPSLEDISPIVEKYLNVGFYNSVWKWLFANFIKIRTEEKNMFCSEFVSFVLMKLNILEDWKTSGKMPYSYTPGDFFKNKVNLSPEYVYGENTFFEY